jgi:DNA-binding transcriptional ArsR family regulator
MSTPSPLQPTLWRTCRTIANRIRLKMFALLLQRPGQTVSAVAEHLSQRLSLSSEYLRALEARGLLKSRRVGRWVEYRPSPATGDGPASGLVSGLRWAFQNEPQPVETIFRLATAFSHPRRIEIFRALQTEPRNLGQIQAATRISGWALHRHLRKLEARAFVTCHLGLYAAAKRPDGLGRELARLAAA